MLFCVLMQIHNPVTQFWMIIIPNHFDDRLWLNHFRMTKTTFEMLCNGIGLLVSPDIHITFSVEAKSCVFIQIYSVCVSIICAYLLIR